MVSLAASTVGNYWRGEPFAAQDPLDPQVVSGWFGEPRNNGVGYHTGIDLAPLDGLPGRALAFTQGAFVTWAGVWNGTRNRDVNGGYGNVLQVRLADQSLLLIAHLASFSPLIHTWIDSGYLPSTKPTFSPGQVIAYQGNSGYVGYTNWVGDFVVPAADDLVTATHTHLEMRLPDGTLVNPRIALQSVYEAQN